MIDSAGLDALQRSSYSRAGAALRGGWPEAAVLTAGELNELLARKRYGVLATATAAGRTPARPVSYVVDGTVFWLATVAGGRLRNLRRAPWASLVVMEGDAADHLAVVVEGPVTIVDAPPPAVIDAWEVRFGSRAEWAAAWVRLEPERLLSHAAYHDDQH